MATAPSPERLDNLHKAVAFLESWQEKSKVKTLESNFFSQLIQGRKDGAKVILEKIKQKSESSKWRKGYINALEGMIVAADTKEDKNMFMNQIKANKSDYFRKIFLQQSKNDMYNDFDKGFFSAWADYTRTLKLIIKSTK